MTKLETTNAIRSSGTKSSVRAEVLDGDTVFRMLFDTIKGGDFRSREAARGQGKDRRRLWSWTAQNAVHLDFSRAVNEQFPAGLLVKRMRGASAPEAVRTVS